MSLYPEAPYEYTRVANGLIFMAGACPLDDEGQVVAPGNCEAQAARATENLLQALAEHDVGPESLLKTTIYVVAEDRDDLVRVWAVVPGAWVACRVRCSVSRFSAIRISWSRSKRSPGPILARTRTLRRFGFLLVAMW